MDEDAAVETTRQDSTHNPVVFMIREIVERAKQNAKALSPNQKNGFGEDVVTISIMDTSKLILCPQLCFYNLGPFYI